MTILAMLFYAEIILTILIVVYFLRTDQRLMYANMYGPNFTHQVFMQLKMVECHEML